MTRNAQKTVYERGARKHWIHTHAPQSANGADKAILTTDNIDTDSCANPVTVLPWRAVDKNIEITDNYILSFRVFWKLFGYKKDLKDLRLSVAPNVTKQVLFHLYTLFWIDQRKIFPAQQKYYLITKLR